MSKQGGFISKLFKRKTKNSGAQKAENDVGATSRWHDSPDSNQPPRINNNDQKEEKEVKITILRSISSETRRAQSEGTVNKSKTRESNSSRKGKGGSVQERDSRSARERKSTSVREREGNSARDREGNSFRDREGNSARDREGNSARDREGNSARDREGNSMREGEGKFSAPDKATCVQKTHAKKGMTGEGFPRTKYSYPEKMSQFIHRAHCYIPAPLAAVLDASPDLVAPMVQAFYYRDPLDLKACVTFTHFRPGTRVLRQVRMTKCLYAQLSQQLFTPDRRSGYTLPPSDDPAFKSHDLGIKLAHGAEILCSKCGSGLSYDDDMSHDLKWQSFLNSLKEKGYFQCEVEGSQLYSKLLDDAKKFFQTSASLQAGDESSPGRKILEVLKTANYDVEEMRKQEKELEPPDDDSWLTVSPEQLDGMLSEAYQDAFQTTTTTTDLNKVAHSMKAFVSKISGHEGAEFPGADDDDDVAFDPDGFIQTMHKMFDFKDEKLTSSEDDMSEYGSEDDLDFEMGPRSNQRGSRSKSGENKRENFMDLTDMKAYMEQMDRELARTEVGKSFEAGGSQKHPVAPPRNKKRQNQHTTSTNAPDSTQNATKTVPSRPKNEPGQLNTDRTESKVAPKANLSEDFSDIDDLDEDFQPVNVDLNLVKNLLESHSSQQGLSGPASNILGSMGMRLPEDSGEAD